MPRTGFEPVFIALKATVLTAETNGAFWNYTKNQTISFYRFFFNFRSSLRLARRLSYPEGGVPNIIGSSKIGGAVIL